MLFVSAVVSIYCVAAVSIDSVTGAPLFAIVGAVVPALLYVLLGGVAIRFADSVRRWSFADRYEPWDDEHKFILGVIWPGVVVFWVTVGIFNHLTSPPIKAS